MGFSPSLLAVGPVASATFTGGEQGRILIQVKVNGKGPFPFIFDTGSVNIVSLDLMNKIGVPVSGRQELSAFGGSVETASAVLDSIQLGDFATSNTVTMPHAEVTVLDGGPFTPGEPVGCLGWEFLAHLVVEIDYEHGRLNFYDPSTYTYAGSGVRVPVTLSNNLIAIRALVYGHPASLVLDSGNENGALVLFHKFAARYKLHGGIEAVTGYGFGGLTRALVTRTPSLEIAGLNVESPRTDLSLDDSGIETGMMDGNLGASLLREFKLTFDVSHSVVYLEPNRWFSKPELDDHSGLVLDLRGETAKVLFVYPNSPAAEAAIRVGDGLTGTGEQNLTGDQWHDLLDAPAGTRASFQVNHAGKTRTVSLTLRTYI